MARTQSLNVLRQRSTKLDKAMCLPSLLTDNNRQVTERNLAGTPDHDSCLNSSRFSTDASKRAFACLSGCGLPGNCVGLCWGDALRFKSASSLECWLLIICGCRFTLRRCNGCTASL
ncbi:hypothetical protein ALC57_14705 [Trachymyrmex cornetzi]|uniref:Uncharacterized protein n=1 Tax=Trachymyrmex cornetzi TaxID=471704 RepID=A0A151IXZ6_9HYME|nr:hypothetical protein ALC57_14705 [Trachymyrmex cornetzi]